MRQSSNLNFAVIGLGRYGSVLARRLEQFGFSVLGVDSDPRRVRAIADEITAAVIADATDEDALLEVDIGSFETVIITIGDDFGAAAQIAASVKDMGVPRIISRADSHRDEEILRRIGADEVVLPLQESAEDLANQLIMPGVLATVHLDTTHTVAEIVVTGKLQGKPVAECERQGVTVVMLIRDEALTISPAGDIILAEQDLLFVVGEQRKLLDFIRAL